MGNAAVAPAIPAQFDRSAQHRRSMIAKANIAKGQLGMVDDDYRQLLFDATGQTSLTTCSDAQLARFLDALKSKGFRPLPSKRGVAPAAQHPMARKARALWISLHHLGVVHNPGEPALEAFARRQLKCERLVWAKQSEANKLIEALKGMAERAGWAQSSPTGGKLSPRALQENLCEAILKRLKRLGVAPDWWTLNRAAWSLCGTVIAQEAPVTAEQYQSLAAALGAVLRKTPGFIAGGEA
jgi:phage gp16-like protein